MQKCWSLKQVLLEQQKLIKAHQQEREQYKKELVRFRNESENAYSFTKYECNKYKKVITHDKVLQQSQTMLADSTGNEKEKVSRERYHNDRYKALSRNKD